MRIALDARLLYYQQAGIAQYTQRLLTALAEIDHENEYVVLQSRKDRRRLVSAANFRRHPLWTPPHHRLEQLTLPLELAPLRLDVLHSPDFIPPLRRNCRAVITVHDLAFLLFPGLLTTESQRYYGQIRQAVHSAEAIIAVSASTKRDLIAHTAAPAAKITVVYEAAGPAFRPVTDAAALAAVRQKYGLPPGFVLFIGTIEPRKNLPTLLQAWAQTRHSSLVTRHSLVIGGKPGWLYEETIAQARELGTAVQFIGGVLPEDLPALYSAARLFVLPSVYEGFGLPVLEAMACGTPVVCSNASSLPEVAGDAALLVEPH
ncbi:MAG: glycosyltransferase family 4 protein, partial [Chloroflexi bacterium]|nr:glycosyltransferase family 4 protein [Chloroflexota bacterium]